jgi:hypothetical protein
MDTSLLNVLRLEGLTKLLDLLSRLRLQRREVEAHVYPQEAFQTSIPRDSITELVKREIGRQKKDRGEKMLGKCCECMV